MEVIGVIGGRDGEAWDEGAPESLLSSSPCAHKDKVMRAPSEMGLPMGQVPWREAYLLTP